MSTNSLLADFLGLLERFTHLTTTTVDDVAIQMLRAVAEYPVVAQWLDKLAVDLADWIDDIVNQHDGDGVPEDTLPIIDVPGDVRAQFTAANVNLDLFIKYLPAILGIWKLLQDMRKRKVGE